VGDVVEVTGVIVGRGGGCAGGGVVIPRGGGEVEGRAGCAGGEGVEGVGWEPSDGGVSAHGSAVGSEDDGVAVGG